MTKVYVFYFLLLSAVYGQNGECAWNYGVPGDHNKVTDNNVRRNLIVDGQAATPHEYPWQVYLTMGCGGSIISRDWVLTAAHCHPGGDGSTTVVAGLNRYRIGGTFISHEEYGVPFSLFNDIALVRLDEPLPCDDPTVGAIALAENTDFSIDDCSAWVTGFGALSSGGGSPYGYEMHEVQTRVYSPDTCNNAPENIYNLPQTQICGFTPGIGQTNNEDSCQGDSGGPFKIDVSTSQGEHTYAQVGIVSYGSGCGTTAGIYTNVPEYKDWILDRVPTAHFIPVTQCDKNHYEEGIIDCEGTDCSLELPYCQGNPSTWSSSDGDTCSSYNSFPLNCFADYGSGYFAFEVCSSCNYCQPGTDTTPLVAPDQGADGSCPGGQNLVEWELTTTSWAKEMGFQIGADCSGSGFQDDSTYSGTCCLPGGTHDVQCTDRYGDGWHRGAQLKVDGATVCGSFEAAQLSSTLSISSGSETATTDTGTIVAAILVPLFICIACVSFYFIYRYSWHKVLALCESCSNKSQQDVESKMPLSPRVVVGAPEAPKSTYVGTDSRRGSYWRNFQTGNQQSIPVSAPPAPPQAANIDWFYVDAQNESQGPVSNAKFETLLGTAVTLETYVWNETMTDWAYVRNIPNLKAKLQKKPVLPARRAPPPFQRPQPAAYQRPQPTAYSSGSSKQNNVASRIAMFNRN